MPVAGLKTLDFPPATPTGTLPGTSRLPSGEPGYFGNGTPGTLDDSETGMDSRKGTDVLPGSVEALLTVLSLTTVLPLSA
jgi:hypothetical protein